MSTVPRGVSLMQFTYFDSCLVFFDFDILSLIKKKNIFCFSVSFWFFSSSLISKIYGVWFLKGRLIRFSKWNRYRSYPGDSFSNGWSAILKARTLRHITWPNATEMVFSQEAASTTNGGSTGHRAPVQRLSNLKKNTYLRGALKESLGKFLPSRPSNPSPA